MNKLVLHHTYANGSTFDISDSFNHGQATAVDPGFGSFANAFFFDVGESRIDVPPSPTLRDLGAIRARVRLFHSPKDSRRRHNVIEGHLSFALFINPDRSIQGTLVDAAGNWRGVTSSPGLVFPNRWHEVELIEDGLGQVQILLDGALVAAVFDVPGTVRSVGPNGISIGHWPEPDPRYTFEGYIGEVQLSKYDPKEEVQQLLDPCCIDREALDKVRDRLKEEGWDADRLGEQVRRMLNMAAEITAAVRAGDANETRTHERNATEAMTAFLRRDAAGYRDAFSRIVAQAVANLSESEIEDMGGRMLRFVEELPLDGDLVRDLSRSLCWEHGILDNISELVPKDRDQPRRPER